MFPSTLVAALSLVSAVSAQGGYGEIQVEPAAIDLRSMEVSADYDNDGNRDLVERAVGAGLTKVVTYSSATGKELWSKTLVGGVLDHSWYNASRYEVTGDGIPDLVLTEPSFGQDAGQVTLASGVDGTSFWTVGGSIAGQKFGQGALIVEDRTGDSIADVFVVEYDNGTGSNKVGLYSGLDGSLVGPAVPTGASGTALYEIGDISGDGLSDVYIAGDWADQGKVFSLDSGVELLNPFPQEPDLFFTDVIDVDGDGIEDLVFQDADYQFPGNNQGSIEVYSGSDGSLISRVGVGRMGGPLTLMQVGIVEGRFTVVARVSDAGGSTAWRVVDLVSGDWLITVGDAELQAQGVFGGLYRFEDNVGGSELRSFTYQHLVTIEYSPFIELRSNELSRSAGGIVEMYLDFPSRDAASFDYRVLASTRTGQISIGEVVVPVGLSALLVETYFLDYSSIPRVIGMYGPLSAQGDSVAAIGALPGDIPAGAVGLGIHLCAIARRDEFSPFSVSTEAVTMTITP